MSLHGISMNVILMMHKIDAIPNPMIGESALPDFLIAADDRSERVRVSTFDQLDRAFNRDVPCGRQKKMNMLRHDDKRVQGVAPFAAIAVDRLQQEPDVRFDGKQFSAVESRESHEIGSGRGDESSRLQGETSAAGSRTSALTLNWHEWNSCPSRWFFVRSFSFWERANG
jgi:hypothetical protein